MQSIGQTIYGSFKSTSKQPRWWILALLQVFCIGYLADFLVFKRTFFVEWGWALTFLLVLQPVCAYLWLDLKAVHENRQEKVYLKQFLFSVLAAFFVCTSAFGLIMLLVNTYGPGVLIFLLCMGVMATAVIAAMGAVILDLGFFRAWGLGLDVWRLKMSIPIIIMVLFVSGFASGFFVWPKFLAWVILNEGFSVSKASATIWILFLIAVIILGFLVAFLNSFLVRVFLNFIKPNSLNKQEAEILLQQNI